MLHCAGLQVLQRGLPRPKTLNSLPAVRPESSLEGLGLKEAAEALLQNELVLLLQHDAAKHPNKVIAPALGPFFLLNIAV